MELLQTNITLRDRAVVARQVHTLKVGGSSPSPATKIISKASYENNVTNSRNEIVSKHKSFEIINSILKQQYNV